MIGPIGLDLPLLLSQFQPDFELFCELAPLIISLLYLSQSLLEGEIGFLELEFHAGDAILKLLLLFVGREGPLVKLIEGDADDDGVENELVEGPDALFEEDLLFELGYLPLVGSFEHSVVEPVLEVMVPATKGHENPPGVGHLVLLLAFLQPAQHRLRKGSNHQGQNLLKWDHYNCYRKYISGSKGRNDREECGY